MRLELLMAGRHELPGQHIKLLPLLLLSMLLLYMSSFNPQDAGFA